MTLTSDADASVLGSGQVPPTGALTDACMRLADLDQFATLDPGGGDVIAAGLWPPANVPHPSGDCLVARRGAPPFDIERPAHRSRLTIGCGRGLDDDDTEASP
jgi:hypothetical protein